VDKGELETLLSRIDIWLLLFGIVVVVGVAGESFFGIRHWWNSRKLQAIQQRENEALRGEIARLNKDANEAKVKLEEFKKRQEARGVPTALLLGELSKYPPGKAVMEYQLGSPETFLFTGNLHSHLLMAKWDIPKPIGVAAIASDKGAALAEIVLSARRLEDPSVQALWNAFMAAGYTRLGSFKDMTLPDDRPRILIGPKL